MSKSHLHAGDINLKGKKSVVLGCRCCDVTDLRDLIEAKHQHTNLQNEINDYRWWNEPTIFDSVLDELEYESYLNWKEFGK